jgi:hypothetical protein
LAEDRFKVLKDFLVLRPVHHSTEERVRGHIALCVIAAVIEALISGDLEREGVGDPDVAGQTMTPRRALAELGRIRLQRVEAAGREIELVTRRNALQAKLCAALSIDTSRWDRASIT